MDYARTIGITILGLLAFAIASAVLWWWWSSSRRRTLGDDYDARDYGRADAQSAKNRVESLDKRFAEHANEHAATKRRVDELTDELTALKRARREDSNDDDDERSWLNHEPRVNALLRKTLDEQRRTDANEYANRRDALELNEEMRKHESRLEQLENWRESSERGVERATRASAAEDADELKELRLRFETAERELDESLRRLDSRVTEEREALRASLNEAREAAIARAAELDATNAAIEERLAKERAAWTDERKAAEARTESALAEERRSRETAIANLVTRAEMNDALADRVTARDLLAWKTANNGNGDDDSSTSDEKRKIWDAAIASKVSRSELREALDAKLDRAAFDEANDRLTSELKRRVDRDEFARELAGKIDRDQLKEARDAAERRAVEIETKERRERDDLLAQLAAKTDRAETTAALTAMQAVLEKSSATALAAKIDRTELEATLAKKADRTELEAKVDRMEHALALAKKADRTELEAKANDADVTEALAGKVDRSELDGFAAHVAKKSDRTDHEKLAERTATLEQQREAVGKSLDELSVELRAKIERIRDEAKKTQEAAFETERKMREAIASAATRDELTAQRRELLEALERANGRLFELEKTSAATRTELTAGRDETKRLDERANEETEAARKERARLEEAIRGIDARLLDLGEKSAAAREKSAAELRALVDETSRRAKASEETVAELRESGLPRSELKKVKRGLVAETRDEMQRSLKSARDELWKEAEAAFAASAEHRALSERVDQLANAKLDVSTFEGRANATAAELATLRRDQQRELKALNDRLVATDDRKADLADLRRAESRLDHEKADAKALEAVRLKTSETETKLRQELSYAIAVGDETRAKSLAAAVDALRVETAEAFVSKPELSERLDRRRRSANMDELRQLYYRIDGRVVAAPRLPATVDTIDETTKLMNDLDSNLAKPDGGGGDRKMNAKATRHLAALFARVVQEGNAKLANEICERYVDDLMSPDGYRPEYSVFQAPYLFAERAKHRRAAADRLIERYRNHPFEKFQIHRLHDAALFVIALYARHGYDPTDADEASSAAKTIRDKIGANTSFLMLLLLRAPDPRRPLGLMHDCSFVSHRNMLDPARLETLARHEFYEIARLVIRWLGLGDRYVPDARRASRVLRAVIRHPSRTVDDTESPLQLALEPGRVLTPCDESRHGVALLPIYRFLRLYTPTLDLAVRLVTEQWPCYVETKREGGLMRDAMIKVQSRVVRYERARNTVISMGWVRNPSAEEQPLTVGYEVFATRAVSFCMKYHQYGIAYQSYEIEAFGRYRFHEIVSMDERAGVAKVVACVHNRDPKQTLAYVGANDAEIPILPNADVGVLTVFEPQKGGADDSGETEARATTTIREKCGDQFKFPLQFTNGIEIRETDSGWIMFVEKRAKIYASKNPNEQNTDTILVNHESTVYGFAYDPDENQWVHNGHVV